MAVVAVVSGTTHPERVLFEAADVADEHETDVHVCYLVGLGWLSNLEVTIADRIGIPVRLDTIRGVCEGKAAHYADPVLDEYQTVGLIGQPIEELIEYAESVDAEWIVFDGNSRLAAGIWKISRDPVDELREAGFSVKPVF